MRREIILQELAEIKHEQWYELWRAYQKFYQADIPEMVSQNTWDKLTCADAPHIYGFAALMDHQPVGMVHVIEHDSCWTVKPYAYLQDLYTHEEYRGQGVARQLIQHVYDYAVQRRKCDRVYWLTQQNNENAQKLYDQVAKKTGFIQYRM